MRPRLKHYLEVFDQFLEHCRWHMPPEEWQAFTQHLQGTPVKEGYNVGEPWTHQQQVVYHWSKLTHDERLAVLYELCTTLEDAP